MPRLARAESRVQRMAARPHQPEQGTAPGRSSGRQAEPHDAARRSVTPDGASRERSERPGRGRLRGGCDVSGQLERAGPWSAAMPPSRSSTGGQAVQGQVRVQHVHGASSDVAPNEADVAERVLRLHLMGAVLCSLCAAPGAAAAATGADLARRLRAKSSCRNRQGRGRCSSAEQHAEDACERRRRCS
jgi:hypothetical protein